MLSILSKASSHITAGFEGKIIRRFSKLRYMGLIGTSFQQSLCDGYIALLYSDMKRRLGHVANCVHIRTGLDKQ